MAVCYIVLNANEQMTRQGDIEQRRQVMKGEPSGNEAFSHSPQLGERSGLRLNVAVLWAGLVIGTRRRPSTGQPSGRAGGSDKMAACACMMKHRG